MTSLLKSDGNSYSHDNSPKCLLLVWQSSEFREVLSKDVAQLSNSGKVHESSLLIILDADHISVSKLSISPLYLRELESILNSKEFTLLAGPAADCQLPILLKSTEKTMTERQKFVSNASSGYSSWMHLRFNIWDEEMGEGCVKSLVSLSLLELTMARDYFRSIVRFFEPFIRDDGTRVGSINLLYQHLISVFQFFDDEAHLEYLLMETLILLILQVPSLNSNLIQRIILELCAQSTSIPPIFALSKFTL